LLLASSGCKPHEFHPPSDEERVAQADSMFTPALFDTIRWESDSAKLFAGNEVWAARCDKCHGPLGEGGTEYAAARKLAVPSIVTPDWSMADQPNEVRRRVYVGHSQGMPTWGVAGIPLRQVDAVTAYILQQLRPEAAARQRQGSTSK
jgi:mono/diheme cytochrome c family protein